MSKVKHSQHKIERWLLSGHSITQIGALSKRFDFCGRLSEVVRRLRRKHDIKTVMVETSHGAHARYVLKKFAKNPKAK